MEYNFPIDTKRCLTKTRKGEIFHILKKKSQIKLQYFDVFWIDSYSTEKITIVNKTLATVCSLLVDTTMVKKVHFKRRIMDQWK
jgi:hypothetical protein